jgi:hypothetical protein
MDKMLNAFAYKDEPISRRQILELFGTPRGHHSTGIVCGPWEALPSSILRQTPFEIIVSLLEIIGIDFCPIMDRHAIETRTRSTAVNSYPA